MRRLHLLVALWMLAAFTLPAQAQFFARKPRLQNLQVPELIVTVKSDPDERKRIAALEILRDFDLKANPNIVPVIIDVMLNDTRSSVRMEAVTSLTRMRPFSQTVGQALQQVAQHDENLRVRWQARTSLWMAGYHGSGNGKDQFVAPPTPTLNEPPLGNGTIIVNPAAPAPSSQQALPVGTPLPPVYAPPTEIKTLPPSNTVSMPRPLPSRPNTGFSTAVPQQPTALPVPPPSTPNDDGPAIIPVP